MVNKIMKTPHTNYVFTDFQDFTNKCNQKNNFDDWEFHQTIKLFNESETGNNSDFAASQNIALNTRSLRVFKAYIKNEERQIFKYFSEKLNLSETILKRLYSKYMDDCFYACSDYEIQKMEERLEPARLELFKCLSLLSGWELYWDVSEEQYEDVFGTQN